MVLDGPRTGVTSDRTVSVSPAGSPADFVSPTGEVLVGIVATRTSSFVLRTDMVRVTIDY